MDIHWSQNILWTTYSIFILMFFNEKSQATNDPITLTDLKQTCLLDFLFDFVPEHVPPKKDHFCSAIGTFSKKVPPPGTDMLKLRDGLPFVHVFNITLHKVVNGERQLIDILADYEENLKILVSKQNIDVMIFDFLQREKKDEYPPRLLTDISTLFTKLKDSKKNLLIGLLIKHKYDNDAELECRLKEKICEVIDIYVVRSYDYKLCFYERKQEFMNGGPSDNDLTSSMNRLKELGFPMDKAFYIIELVVKSWKKQFTDMWEPWSYTYKCKAEAGNDRKFCKQSLENLHLQAKTIRKYPVAGIFIQSADNDDAENACKCGHFPAAKVIYSGNYEQNVDSSLLTCNNFGKLADDLE